MNIPQQLRLLTPVDDVPPASLDGSNVVSATTGARLRCFVESTSWRSLPALEGVDYVLDDKSEFDLILIPGDPGARVIERLLGQVHSPAPVIICRSQTLGPRADLVLSDWSAPSLSAAICSFEPLITRVSELPRLPLGPDRNGLAALAFAYTRDCSLMASLQPNDPAVVAYPLLFGVSNARRMLEEMADAGMLRRRFFERLHICQHCDSSRLHAREVCVKCHSSHLAEQSLMHHYACGYQATQAQFEVGDRYVCPKCRKELLHFGVDYDKPGSVMCCTPCGEIMTEPEVKFLCLDCARYTSSDHAGFRDWHHYDLLPDGVAAVRSGELPTADSVNGPRRGSTRRDFRLLVSHSLSVSQRMGRPLSGARLTVDTAELANRIGQRGVAVVVELIRDAAFQNIRAYDIAANLADGVLVCLPETDEATAKLVADRIQRAIFAAVHPKLKMKIETFPISQVEQQLLNAIQ